MFLTGKFLNYPIFEKIIQRGKVYEAYPLGNHQGRALDYASFFVLGMSVTILSFYLHENYLAKM